jgi:anti-anti-sigma factor
MLEQLHVRTVNDEDHLVEVVGDLVSADAPRLAEALVQFDAGDVIVDLSGVTTIHGAAVRALDAAQRHIARRRGQLIIQGASRVVGHALKSPAPASPANRFAVPPSMRSFDTRAIRGNEGRDDLVHSDAFFVDASRVADTHVLRFVGELDLQFAVEARNTSIAALPDTTTVPAVLVLDLSELTFCDASGIGAIVQLAHAAAARGYRTVLRNPQQNVRTVLAITHVDTWLDIESGMSHDHGAGCSHIGKEN